MKFIMENNFEKTQKLNNSIIKTAVLGGGCFWCTESDFEKVNGVISVESGYTGGNGINPSYEDYGSRGFREVVLISYDSKILKFSDLVFYLIKHSDATDGNGSFNDRGQEYASAVYYETNDEKKQAEKIIKEIDSRKIYKKLLELVILPRDKFWLAEDYHQDYYKKNTIKYLYYRQASGRDSFIKKYWGNDLGIEKKYQKNNIVNPEWEMYSKPSKEELQKNLTPLQYFVTQRNGTEEPFKNIYNDNKDVGIYVDLLSGEPLFSSKDKYDSNTGWPSFVSPIMEDVVALRKDNGIFTSRIEVRSRYSDSHLGHVFDDGPKNRGGLRYCINSVSLKFIKKADMKKEGYDKYIQFID
ncbi:MAG: peptide-methionine (R)-S-oxide reductase [Candidatus Levybacteria bacterium]|nr:peptide-methionine (R)-S-oxide reductase [Candidatus Levybacteria bacterium]